MSRISGLVALVLLVGCGDVDSKNNGVNNGLNNGANNGANNGVADGDCYLTIGLQGGVTEDLDWGLSEGCGGGGVEDDSVTVGFGGITTELNVRVTILETERGATGTFPAEVTIRNVESDDRWLAGCTVDLTRNELVSENDVGTSYALEGTGSCVDPAAPVEPNSGEEVTVSDFEFSSTALW